MFREIKDIYETLAMMARLQLHEPFSERFWHPYTAPFSTRSPLVQRPKPPANSTPPADQPGQSMPTGQCADKTLQGSQSASLVRGQMSTALRMGRSCHHDNRAAARSDGALLTRH